MGAVAVEKDGLRVDITVGAAEVTLGVEVWEDGRKLGLDSADNVGRTPISVVVVM